MALRSSLVLALCILALPGWGFAKDHGSRSQEASQQGLLLEQMYLGEGGNASQYAQLLQLMTEISTAAIRGEVSPLANDALLPAPMRISVARAANTPLRPYEWTEKRSVDGQLAVELDVDYVNAHINPDPVRLRSYNGQLVGPILRVKAGDTLRITLRNKLPADTQTGHANGHHAWNSTNLHFHGLHVAPQGTPEAESDNVFLSLAGPNGEQKYEFAIPEHHVAGTFWYHAHKHGAVAAQVSSGLAGALIVERDDGTHNLDAVDAIRNAKEQILVFQQVPYLKRADGVGVIELDTVPNAPDIMFSPQYWHRSGLFTTVNGEKLPVLTMAPGEVQRFRMIHSGQREALKLRILEDPQRAEGEPRTISFHEIALEPDKKPLIESN